MANKTPLSPKNGKDQYAFWRAARARRERGRWVMITAACLVMLAAVFLVAQDIWWADPNDDLPAGESGQDENPPIGDTGENSFPVVITEEEPDEETSPPPESETGEEAEEEQPSEEASAAPAIWLPPTLGEPSRSYGYNYDKTMGDFRFHGGVDIPLALASPVFAAAEGKIIAAGEDERWHGRVEIEHGGGFVSVYLGVTASGLNIGQHVEGGETIATITAPPPAEAAGESHLHFELLLNGKRVDPATYISFIQ